MKYHQCPLRIEDAAMLYNARRFLTGESLRRRAFLSAQTSAAQPQHERRQYTSNRTNQQRVAHLQRRRRRAQPIIELADDV